MSWSLRLRRAILSAEASCRSPDRPLSGRIAEQERLPCSCLPRLAEPVSSPGNSHPAASSAINAMSDFINLAPSLPLKLAVLVLPRIPASNWRATY